jgi:hypothetical protein
VTVLNLDKFVHPGSRRLGGHGDGDPAPFKLKTCSAGPSGGACNGILVKIFDGLTIPATLQGTFCRVRAGNREEKPNESPKEVKKAMPGHDAFLVNPGQRGWPNFEPYQRARTQISTRDA